MPPIIEKRIGELMTGYKFVLHDKNPKKRDSKDTRRPTYNVLLSKSGGDRIISNGGSPPLGNTAGNNQMSQGPVTGQEARPGSRGHLSQPHADQRPTNDAGNVDPPLADPTYTPVPFDGGQQDGNVGQTAIGHETNQPARNDRGDRVNETDARPRTTQSKTSPRVDSDHRYGRAEIRSSEFEDVSKESQSAGGRWSPSREHVRRERKPQTDPYLRPQEDYARKKRKHRGRSSTVPLKEYTRKKSKPRAASASRRRHRERHNSVHHSRRRYSSPTRFNTKQIPQARRSRGHYRERDEVPVFK